MARKKKRGKPERKLRGRPPLVNPQVVIGSADMYGGWLRQYWPKLGRHLLDANSAEEINQAIQQEAPSVSASLAPFSALMLAIIHDRRFPRVRSEAQIQFLADSLGAQGLVTPRRSREICAKERTKVKHVIVRKEYYIECSCGYNGPALDGACRDCGTAELSWGLLVKEQA
jgi:hypothetical protein